MDETARKLRVTRGGLLARGLTNRCPNCGGRTLFRTGRVFELNTACPRCGLELERDEGFFLGSLSLNYGVTIVGFLVPVTVLWLCGVLAGRAAAVLAVAGGVLFPALFYRASRSWWLMLYYLFLPRHLPANRGDERRDGDGND